ncbi:hypothetical protein [Candidatus Palauibacter sp.]|uniref:hypothetical protein n=1 Tax=Candidatus Palauibacter sp. TaxID=3101350 RepID=UPI003AF2D2FE
MSDPEVSIDALARRCFERSAEAAEERLDKEAASSGTSAGDFKAVGCMVALVIVGACVAGVSAGPGGFLAVIVPAAVIWLLADISKHAPTRRRRSEIRKTVAHGIAAYRNGEPWAVVRVHEFAVAEFRERIAEHRARTLGADSEWGRARASLAEAADEAQRSSAYWHERLRAEPGGELARAQGRIANRLEAKLGEALGKLDARAAALRKFYNGCDARLSVMDRCNRDLEESRRLEELSGRADIVIAEAQGVMESIARAFVAEAHTMGEALGVVATVGIKSLAGEASVDNIEYFADRIIEDSDRERSALEDLDRRSIPLSS